MDLIGAMTSVVGISASSLVYILGWNHNVMVAFADYPYLWSLE
jgi:hypothetical protein